MSLNYSITRSDHGTVVTVFANGDVFTVNDRHPNYQKVKEAVLADDDTADFASLTDIAKGVEAAFNKVSERVSIKGNNVYFDGDVVNNALTAQIIRFVNEGVDDFRPLVAFYENVQQNPNGHSRDQLYTWLAERDFTITDDGCFLAYKGLGTDGRSIHSGPATVDGKPMNGRIPNEVGSVIEMPRSSVQHDPARGCSTGLHAGTYEYASSFGHSLVKVKINPRDVVSVPTDCGGQKLRTSRYEVLEAVERQDDPALYGHDYNEVGPDDDWDWDVAQRAVDDAYDAGWGEDDDSDDEGYNDVYDTYRVGSDSDPDKVYTITEYNDGTLECDCPSFRFSATDECKHTRRF